MFHLIWQLSNTQQSWPLFLGTQALLDFHKSRLSCFSLTSLVTPVFFVGLSFLPTFLGPFLSLIYSQNSTYKLQIFLFPELQTSVVHCISLLACHTCASDLPFFFQTCLSLSIPLFCNQGTYHRLPSFSSQKIISVLQFLPPQYLSITTVTLKSNHHWSSSL